MIKWTSLYSMFDVSSPRFDFGEAPCERWGHASVIVDQTLYIIGGFNNILSFALDTYKGDFWSFSFKTCRFSCIEVNYSDATVKKYKRSNHSASYHPGTQSIYLFGGSVEHTQYNDLIAFHIPTNTLQKVKVKGDTAPRERTYHAEEIMGDLVFIVGGESNVGDLQDIWAFDINTKKWILPEVKGLIPKRRFLSCTGIKGKLYLFGGCVKEYMLSE